MRMFSVVVPVLNGERYLRQCLESILSQEIKPEVIVIDGGSTDSTLTILKEYREHIDYFETGLDKGISDAFNRGISRAHGEFIAILNSDDYWEKDVLSRVAGQVASDSTIGIIHGSCRFIPVSGDTYIKKPNPPALKRYMSVYHPAMFVRKEVYELVGNYSLNYKYAMDSEWLHRACSKKIKMGEIEGVLSNMRMGGASDVSSTKALYEYRDSVIANGLAGSAYANLFLYLHMLSKKLDKNPLSKNIKKLFNKLMNDTVKY